MISDRVTLCSLLPRYLPLPKRQHLSPLAHLARPQAGASAPAPGDGAAAAKVDVSFLVEASRCVTEKHSHGSELSGFPPCLMVLNSCRRMGNSHAWRPSRRWRPPRGPLPMIPFTMHSKVTKYLKP